MAQPELAQLRYEVNALRRDFTDLRAHIARLPASARGAPVAPEPAATDPGSAAAQQVNPVEATFQRETPDPAWSRNATASVRSALAQADSTLDRQVSRIECRSNTCRVEINPTAAATLENELPAILAHLAPTMPNVAATQIGYDDDKQPTVLYLTR